MLAENKLIKISSPIGLQIDNLVYDKHRELYRISYNDFNRFRHPDMGGDYGLYAIPLTPEILERCGFYETGVDDEFIYNERGIIKININSIGLISFNVGEIIFSTVHCLHQLQNLYHALTGEELQIKDLI